METEAKTNANTTNGGTSAGALPDANRLAEASSRAGATVEPSRKRGRPLGSKSHAGSNGARVEANPEKVETPIAPVDREFVEKTAAVALKVIDGMLTRRVANAVLSIDISLENQAKQFAAAVALSDDEIKMASGTVGVLAEKYPRLFGYAPEITLGVFALSYGARVFTTLSDIKKLSAEVLEFKREQQRNGTQPMPIAPKETGK